MSRAPAILLLSGLVSFAALMEVISVRRARRFFASRVRGRNWREAFPGASDESVHTFLAAFTNAFCHLHRFQERLQPDDRVMELHLGTMPILGGDGIDGLCWERKLRKLYGIELSRIWRDDITLGDVFRLTLRSSSLDTTAPRVV